MRIQFIKATPTAVVRGEWFAVDIRIVNESNSTVKITSKVAPRSNFLFTSPPPPPPSPPHPLPPYVPAPHFYLDCSLDFGERVSR